MLPRLAFHQSITSSGLARAIAPAPPKPYSGHGGGPLAFASYGQTTYPAPLKTPSATYPSALTAPIGASAAAFAAGPRGFLAIMFYISDSFRPWACWLQPGFRPCPRRFRLRSVRTPKGRFVFICPKDIAEAYEQITVNYEENLKRLAEINKSKSNKLKISTFLYLGILFLLFLFSLVNI